VEVENNMMWGFGWGFMFLGPVCMIFIALAIYFVFMYPRRDGHGHCGHHYTPNYANQNRALDVLNERFAKGEITREQYLQMRKTMEENQ
jgi:putative membrane protein